MNEINLPIKYALSPVLSKSNEIVGYVVVKCYLLEGSIICNLDGSMDSRCKIIECKDAPKAFRDDVIDIEYIREVSCVFNDIELAQDEQRKVNELIIEQLNKTGQIEDLVKFKEKQEATIRSVQKLRIIFDKNYNVTASGKRLIYSKE